MSARGGGRRTLRAAALVVAAGLIAGASAALPAPEDSLAPSALEPGTFKEAWARAHGGAGGQPGRASDLDRNRYDALHVDLTVEPHIAETAIDGRASWKLAILDPPPDAILFDFRDNLEVLSASINALPVVFTLQPARLRLVPPGPLNPGDTLEVAIAYRGQIGSGFHFGFKFSDHDGIPVVYTNCEPNDAPTWWPCKDRPDDKFTADLSFIVPDSLVAASNGLLADVQDLPGGRRLYHWVERYPITTYLVSLVATDFATFEDTYTASDGRTMPLTHYAFPPDLPRARRDWAFTPQAIAALAERFGEYPFLDEKYGMAEFPWSGAMEHQTLTSMGRYFLHLPEPADWVVVHELAHQWWGDWVTCGTWRDIWLNEGFATYCEALWAEHLGGPDSLRASMRAKRADHFNGSCYDPVSLFNSTVYRKGAWVLHMLRHVVGDEVFFGALRQYGADHAYGSAVTADLQRAFEDAGGGDLDWFFGPWVYGEGQPRYRVYWEPLAGDVTGATRVRVEIGQETTGPEYFTMPLDARFWLADGTVFDTVLWDSLSLQAFTVALPAPPESLAIDPDEWVLGKVWFVAEPSAIVEDDATPGAPRILLDAPSPNPSSSLALVPLRCDGVTRVEAARATLIIFDAGGRQVRRLLPEDAAGGRLAFAWDGRDHAGRETPPGVYFARLGADRGKPAGASVRILRVR
jgi:aminopeptidase N